MTLQDLFSLADGVGTLAGAVTVSVVVVWAFATGRIMTRRQHDDIVDAERRSLEVERRIAGIYKRALDDKDGETAALAEVVRKIDKELFGDGGD